VEIRTEGLVKCYRGRPVVNGISLEVRQGEVVGLLGPNGAGKTTTFYMIVGLVKPNRGQVLLDSEDITRRPMYKRARAGISYLPQEASVFRNLTVEENLILVLQMQKLTNAQRRQRTDELLEELHIGHKRYELGKILSGGERRRVEIARALAADPKFILLDEPFTGVDPKAIEDIENIIYRLSKQSNIGILITDHNVEAMLRITERAYIITDGEKRFEGPSDSLLGNPEARASYFGERYGQERRDPAREAALAELERLSGVWDEPLPDAEDPEPQDKRVEAKPVERKDKKDAAKGSAPGSEGEADATDR
jgi:lipopolysaccharide export system ATP-binding protein